MRRGIEHTKRCPGISDDGGEVRLGDSCIGIRTMLMQGKHAYLQAGAGIVADSDPAREFEESMNKAQALLRAVEKARGRSQ